MTMSKFRATCQPGSQVCLSWDSSRRGIVRRISSDRTRALVLWQGGDVTWARYFVLEVICPTL